MLLTYATADRSRMLSMMASSPNELLLDLLVWRRICYGHIAQRSLQHRWPQHMLGT